mgnify:CR=1 FL=1
MRCCNLAAFHCCAKKSDRFNNQNLKIVFNFKFIINTCYSNFQILNNYQSLEFVN